MFDSGKKLCSNNTNKFSPQEQLSTSNSKVLCSNNTNKFSPQEQAEDACNAYHGSNNTNKFSPQEHSDVNGVYGRVQIIQINLVLKNMRSCQLLFHQFK